MDKEGGWDVTFDLEAPELANEVARKHKEQHLAQLASQKKEENPIRIIVNSSGADVAKSSNDHTDVEMARSRHGPFGRP